MALAPHPRERRTPASVFPESPNSRIAKVRAACHKSGMTMTPSLTDLEAHVGRYPDDAGAWRALGRAQRAAGAEDAASAAELNAIAAAKSDPLLLEAGLALVDNDIPTAEHLLRGRLRDDPFDVAAIRMFAEVAARVGRTADAEKLLRRALELAPDFVAARANLAMVLHRQARSGEAVEILEQVLAVDPDNPGHKNLKAAALVRVGGFEDAIAIYEEMVARFPDNAKLWMSFGHVLKTVGRQEEGVAAYRRAIAIQPGFGEAWWSLANLKTVKFDAEDRAAMTAALSRSDLSAEDRYHLHFSLGKAWEDAPDAPDRAEHSFAHYRDGNALRRAEIGYQPERITAMVARSRALLASGALTGAAGGDPRGDVIFILGMPRAGSTLIEQILASHSLIEGTQELPEIPAIAQDLQRRFDGLGAGCERVEGEDGFASAYPALLAQLDAAECAALGERYLANSQIQRKTDKPYFIDKLPNNWLHIPLIHRILPNAKIIDARRHPLDCCFSNFRQHFARGQNFSYALDDMGLYYRDYVDMMQGVDDALPGKVHRVIHEQVVDDLEGEVRRLLAYLGLPFEEACLRFHENDRAVRTASSEQVRRPINRDGMDRWQDYDRWLGPLRDALGDVLTAYPDPPSR